MCFHNSPYVKSMFMITAVLFGAWTRVMQYGCGLSQAQAVGFRNREIWKDHGTSEQNKGEEVWKPFTDQYQSRLSRALFTLQLFT